MFKKIVDQLHGIRLELDGLTKALRLASTELREVSESGADGERLSALEGRMEVVLGQVEAGLIKAASLKAAARAAEDRARGHQNRGDKAYGLAASLESGEEADPFEQAARAYADQVQSGDGGPGNGMSAVPEGMEGGGSGLDAARAAKRGVR